MGYQLPVAIGDVLKRIQRRELVLPAIQREFVWNATQIETLFDSLMRGYPIGSLLSWSVKPGTAAQFKFYDFMRDYHEWTNPHCKVLDLAPETHVRAVLDGQQRLTALNIGLRGSYADRKPGAWRYRTWSYPVRRLYLNLAQLAQDNEDGRIYDFRLLSDEQLESFVGDSGYQWFPVHLCYELDIADLVGEVAARGMGSNPEAGKMAVKLWQVIHSDQSLYFYEEEDQDVERVLDIFIRVNSGGTQLSYSDLLLSIATAQWTERDARQEIHGLLDTLNATGAGFNFSKDVVLKAGLVLAGVSDIGFRVRNFNAANMATLQERWDEISSALSTAANLLADFGLSDATLTADSVLIPLAYYIHHRGLDDSYRDRPVHTNDRALVRSWVLRSLIKAGVWGSGLDSLLRDLRDVIRQHGDSGFPIARIESSMAARGKSLVLGDEEVEDLLNLRYGRNRTFAVLAVLFPHVNTRNIHHVDHVFPSSLLRTTKLRTDGFTGEQIEAMQGRRDRLPNLQLLEGPENVAKSDIPPAVWVESNYVPDAAAAHLERHELPWLPSSADQFDEFFEARREALAGRIKRMLGTSVVASGEPAVHADVEAALPQYVPE